MLTPSSFPSQEKMQTWQAFDCTGALESCVMEGLGLGVMRQCQCFTVPPEKAICKNSITVT